MTRQTAADFTTEARRSASVSGRRARRLFAAINIGVFHVATVIAVLVAWRYGVHAGHLLVAAGMFVLTAAVGVEVGFHRYFSHRSFDARPSLRWVLAALGCMAGQGSVVFWAGIHRRHHAHADSPGDPHSPYLHGSHFMGRVRGFWHAHVGWLLTGDDYKSSANAIDILRDPIAYGVSRRYGTWALIGLLLPTLAGALIESSTFGAAQGLLWGGFVRVFAGQHFIWGVNSLGHTLGPRAFASGDHSRNSWLLALPSFGGSLHNNHHAFPSSASTSRHWWEPDLSGAIISLFVLTGLATNPKRPGELAIKKRSLARALENER